MHLANTLFGVADQYTLCEFEFQQMGWESGGHQNSGYDLDEVFRCKLNGRDIDGEADRRIPV
jgi:hypothetical protein